MITSSFKMKSTNGTQVHITCWMPEPETIVKSVIQIAHGMTAHAMNALPKL